jgi:glycosyltransferase involved in cell wall biosynthesis
MRYVAPVDPRVSVCLVTYNQARYIGQALDSVLQQRTRFPFEICLGEDESDDGTREICVRYAAAHPDRIRLLLHRREDSVRIAGFPTARFNFLETLKACRGDYVAFLDGDDYWTDLSKLERQAQALESHPEASICHHPCMVIREEQGARPQPDVEGRRRFPRWADISYMAEFRIPRLSSCMVRRTQVEPVLPLLSTPLSADRVLLLLLARDGIALMLDRSMAVYRAASGGLTRAGSPSRRLERKLLTSVQVLGLVDQGVFEPDLRAAVVRYLEGVVSNALFNDSMTLDEFIEGTAVLGPVFDAESWARVCRRVHARSQSLLAESRRPWPVRVASRVFRRIVR